MYCSYCGDFQYSDTYDEIIGANRSGPRTSHSHPADNTAIINNTVQANNINNMDIDNNSVNESNSIKISIKKEKHTSKKVNLNAVWKDPRGIINMGSTCFMNSILQTILQNPIILTSQYLENSRDLCTKIQQEQLVSSSSSSSSQNVDSVCSGCIACEMQSIVQLASSETTTNGFNNIVPANLLYSVWNYADHMAGYDQQDAHEFLIALIDGLGTHLDKYHPDTIRQIVKPLEINKIQNNIGAHSTFVHDIFSGSMKSDLHCGFCSHQSCKYERFIDISLSLLKTFNGSDTNDNVVGSPNKVKGKEIDSISLKECLQNFTLLEPLSELVMCDVCKKPQPANKQLNISSLPKVLVLHLKRFDSIRQQKLNTKVTFDLIDLDMSPFTCLAPKTDTNDMIFDLQGVITHKGSLNSGHYIAYIAGNPIYAKGNSSRWLRCDDEHIVEVSADEVKEAEP